MTSDIRRRPAHPPGAEHETASSPDVHSLFALHDTLIHTLSEDESRQLIATGEQLRHIRTVASLTRPEFARHLDIDVGLLVALENGHGTAELADNVLERARTLTQNQ